MSSMIRKSIQIYLISVLFTSTTRALLSQNRFHTPTQQPLALGETGTKLLAVSSGNNPTDDITPSTPSNTAVSRRNLLLTPAKSLFSLSLISFHATRANAATTSATLSTTTARISEWPSVAYLEPIYELKLSIDALAVAVEDPSKRPLIQKRLEKFFGGGVVSEKNYYAGVSYEYVERIKYAKEELKEYVRIDKQQRFTAMDATLKSLESLKKSLGDSSNNNGSGGDADVLADADSAQRALRQWFSYVRREDVEAVDALFRAVRVADVNRDKHLDDEELATLSGADRVIWKKRVELYGDV